MNEVGSLRVHDTSEHCKRERSARHSKRLDALLLATVNLLAKDEPLPHRYFDRPLGGDME